MADATFRFIQAKAKEAMKRLGMRGGQGDKVIS